MLKSAWILLTGTLVALLALIAVGVWQYGGNVSTLMHIDTVFGETHKVPEGIVLYKDGGYDGMLYYQVARDLPALFLGEKTSLDSPYRFQRILFPLLGFALALGNEQYFPFTFLLLNLLASLGSLVFFLCMRKKIDIHTLTVICNPAILVGILFSLTEPVSFFFMMLFFLLWQRSSRTITVAGITALTLSLFARETTIFLIGMLLLWSLWYKQWRSILLLCIPVVLLIFWQYFLELQFGTIGFQADSNLVDLPFVGPWHALLWAWQHTGLTRFYRLSSVALLSFLLPLTFLLGKEWIQKRQRITFFPFVLSGLAAAMLSMDAHIWGVITSVGRVVTPIYPVYALFAAERDTKTLRVLSWILVLTSVIAAIGIALQVHPFVQS